MKKKIVIIENENKFPESLIKDLNEFEILYEGYGDLILEAKDDGKISLIFGEEQDIVSSNVKFFNFDNKYYKEGFPIEKRNNVAIILRNSNGEIMCLNWNNEKKWKSFVAGGIENGNLIQSALDEIKEEAGYINVKFVEEIDCETRDRFFAPHKNVNRYQISKAVVFDLVDEERLNISEDEIKKHTPIWIKKEEILDFLNIENHKFLFRKYLGENQEYDSVAVLIKDMLIDKH